MMSMAKRSLMLCLVSGPALAGLQEDMAACLPLTDPAQRLACYDAANGRRPSPAESASTGAKDLSPGDATRQTVSAMQRAWDLVPQPTSAFSIRPYRPVYLLPLFVARRANTAPYSPTQPALHADGVRGLEAKFQLSFKSKLAGNLFGDNGDLWAGYTQSSRWQVYSKDISRPFRETNYEPEAFLIWRTALQPFGVDLRFAGIGISHQSNGRSDPLSRSWNRVIGQLGFEHGDTTATIRAWKRIREHLADDDNPDIERYLGRAEILLTHKVGGHLLTAQTHHPLSGGSTSKGSLRLDWAFPISGSLRGHVQAFSGHGESMIDYNHSSNYLGVGISLIELY